MKHCCLITLLLLAFCVEDAAACGPFFPNCYLADGRETTIINMPEANLYHELARLAPGNPNPMARGLSGQWDRTLAADLADLALALDAKQRGRVVAQYKALRLSMQAQHSPKPRRFVPANKRKSSKPFDLSPHAALLKEIPEEFRLYLEGAAAYRANDVKTAIQHWKELLSLPDNERRHRSVWASFMVGKANIGIDDQAAIKAFETTRRLAAEGLRDSLKLAEVSLGWQAMAEKNSGDFLAALKRYFSMFESGSPTARWVGYTSLRRSLGDIPRQTKLYPSLAADPTARRLVTVWMLTGSPSWSWRLPHSGAWLKAVEAAKVSVEASEADRLAWLAYNTGHADEAQRWLDVSDKSTHYGRWVQSKLYMRDGKLEEAITILRELAVAFPTSEEWRQSEFHTVKPRSETSAELGILLLGRKEYVSALDALTRSDYWWAAAYVAERVVTIDELAAYVDRNHGGPINQALRPLLARRLARDGQLVRARKYFPKKLLPGFDQYAKALKDGRDTTRTKRQRAESLYGAANLTGKWGYSLLGIVSFGYPQKSDVAEVRQESPSRAKITGVPDSLNAALSASDDELKRSVAHAARPDTRYHFHFLASELMWECAQLLPDNDPLTAKALYYGGVWTKYRDPKFADRFYKSLVRRCRKLPIGQEADRLRWFPRNPPE